MFIIVSCTAYHTFCYNTRTDSRSSLLIITSFANITLSLSLSLTHSLSLSFTLSLSLSLTLFNCHSLYTLFNSHLLSLSLASGDYPALQYPSTKPKVEKIGNLLWGPRAWAGVLSFVDFLHINVAGKSRTDLDVIEKIVRDLKITNQNKIRFNFNETINRGEFDGATPEKKQGERCYDNQSTLEPVLMKSAMVDTVL